MTAPAAAAGRFAAAVLLGLAAGLLYGFLRPLRRRRNWAADLVFLAGLTALWVYHSFAVCRGDIRLWGLLGLLLGCRIWDVTVGRLLRPLFSWFWGALRGIFKVFLWPFTEILKIFPVFVKKLFASGKKSGTIKWNFLLENFNIEFWR